MSEAQRLTRGVKRQDGGGNLSSISCQLSSKKAFTIVELLVVIAIIAILAGAITMGVNGMFYKSRRSKAIALRNMLQSGLETYYARKGEWPSPISSHVNDGKSDEILLSATEADNCFREIVKVSTGVNASPVMDPSGLIIAKGIDDYGCTDVHRNWGYVTDEQYGPIIPKAFQHKCSGKCAYGRDFKEATKKGAKNKITLSQMNFGYVGPNNGRFCRFRLYYYPKADTVKVLMQPANEYYSRKYRNGYIDD